MISEGNNLQPDRELMRTALHDVAQILIDNDNKINTMLESDQYSEESMIKAVDYYRGIGANR